MAWFDIQKIITAVESVAHADTPDESNGKIDTSDEKSIFQSELDAAVKRGEISEQSANTIFGLYTSEDAAAPESKKVRKRKENFVLDKIKVMSIDDIRNTDTLLEKLNKTLEKNGDYANNTLTKAVVEVAGMFAAKKFNSKDDIEKIEDELEDAIEANDADPMQDFKLKVLEILIDNAKAAQRAKEAAEVAARYNELRHPEGEGTTPLSRAAAMKQVKKEFWNKGSYYRSIAADVERDLVIPDAVEQVHKSIRNQTGNEKATTLGEVRDAVEAELGDDYDSYAAGVLRRGEDGSRTFNEQFVKLDPSLTKALAKSVAADNRIALAVKNGLTEEDLEDAFGTHFWSLDWSNNYEAIEKLISAGLIVERKDGSGKGTGKYDIALLSSMIGDNAGGNNAIDYQKKDYIPYSEVENLIKNILSEGEATATEIGKQDIIKLLKYCGYDYNEDGFFKKLYQNTLGGVANMVTGVASAFGVDATANARLNKSMVDIPIDVILNSTQDFELHFSSNSEFIGIDWDALEDGLLDQGFTHNDYTIDRENGILIIHRTETTINSGILEGIDLKALGVDAEADVEMARKKAMLITAGITAAIVLLNAALKESSGELPVATTQFDSKTSYEKYCKMIDLDKKGSPQVKAALKALANAFVQLDDEGKPKLDANGNKIWNSEGYRQFLNKLAGDSSMLNKYELLIGAMKALDKPEELVQAAQVDDLCDEAEELRAENQALRDELATRTTSTPEPAKGKVRTRPTSYQTHTEDGSHTGWVQLADAYKNCFDKYFENNEVPVLKYNGKFVRSKTLAKTRIIKLMQGITDGNFSAARIKELLDMVYKMEHKQPYTVPEWFNMADYKSALGGAPGKKTAMPDHILYEENVPEYDLSPEQKADYCKRETFQNVTATNKGNIGVATRNGGSVNGTIYEVDENNDGNYKPISKADYDKKVQEGYTVES